MNHEQYSYNTDTINAIPFSSDIEWNQESIATIRHYNNSPIVKQQLLPVMIVEDTVKTFSVPQNTFADPDGDDLVLSAEIAGGSPLPEWLSFNSLTKEFHAEPPDDFNGGFPIRILASDGHSSAADVFILSVFPVNDAPYVTDDFGYTVPAGKTLLLGTESLLQNDFDVDGDPLAITELITYSPHATVNFNENGDIIYKVAKYFTGQDRFEYVVNDGHFKTTGTVTLDITEAHSDIEDIARNSREVSHTAIDGSSTVGDMIKSDDNNQLIDLTSKTNPMPFLSGSDQILIEIDGIDDFYDLMEPTYLEGSGLTFYLGEDGRMVFDTNNYQNTVQDDFSFL